MIPGGLHDRTPPALFLRAGGPPQRPQWKPQSIFLFYSLPFHCYTLKIFPIYTLIFSSIGGAQTCPRYEAGLGDDTHVQTSQPGNVRCSKLVSERTHNRKRNAKVVVLLSKSETNTCL